MSGQGCLWHTLKLVGKNVYYRKKNQYKHICHGKYRIIYSVVFEYNATMCTIIKLLLKFVCFTLKIKV